MAKYTFYQKSIFVKLKKCILNSLDISTVHWSELLDNSRQKRIKQTNVLPVQNHFISSHLQGAVELETEILEREDYLVNIIIWWASILETKTERDSQKKPGAYLINQKMFLFPDKGSVDLKVLVPIK